MAKGYRADRLGGEIRRIISSMLLLEIKDPRLTSRMVSVTDCEVTSDGSYATCYITVMPTGSDGREESEEERAESKKEVLEGLASASGLIRKQIGKEIKIRRIPELIFKFDESMDYGAHIEKVIRELKENE